ncbi:MAG: type IV secretory system conjugative DNA transfer family protein, partial [Lachnospiraceae bacterium]|nr:type IV secretory system conjugative DNA transfer family protein [Lachnospiraceae bacterium]
MKYIKKLSPLKIIRTILIAVLIAGVVGAAVNYVMGYVSAFGTGESYVFDPHIMLEPKTWGIGALAAVLVGVLYLLSGNNLDMVFGTGRGMLGKEGEVDVVEGALENSRFMTDKERDSYFPGHDYTELEKLTGPKNDGIPLRAELDKKNHLKVNFLNGAHSLIIGATGSGKTTTFINPMIQLLGATGCGSSMIMTDPKGELFSLHSQYLSERGYKVLLLDLRDTYSSSRWNPLGSIYDMYQEYVEAGKGITAHRDSMEDYPELLRPDGDAAEGALWCEWNGRAYADTTHCQDDVSVARQKIYDEMYEDLNDLISVICPIENEKDPVWEKGARSIIMATCLAMLEDSEDPRLGMTK